MKKKNRILIYPLIVMGMLFMLTNSCKKDEKKDVPTPTPVLTVGQSYQGGYIAYFLKQGDPGYDANVQHGLIAAPYDQSTAPWGCSGSSIPGTSTAIGTGQANTALIVNTCSETGIAARLCDDLVVGGHSDWYLPSKDELNKLYLNQAAIGGFEITAYYWSSSEYISTQAWRQNFGSGVPGPDYKGSPNYVRAVRAF